MAVEFKIEGTKEIKRRLGLLPQRLGQNAARRALRRGANVIRDDARANAKRLNDPTTPQDIAKNIVVKGMKRGDERRQKVVGMRVGILGGAKRVARASGEIQGAGRANPGGDTYYWRFLEFGTSKMPAKPFMRPAMNNKASQAMDAATTAMITEADKELRKIK